jgi:hypothetical protein
MSARAVDPARSRIVLVGTPAYTDDQLPDLPQVAVNLADLAAVFTDPLLGGFPEAHCVVAPPEATLDQIGDLLSAAAEQAEDLLLFYYVGHGILGRVGELYLSLYSTRLHAPEYSALRFETVRGTFLDSAATNRLVVVDSCYSGRAIGQTLTAEVSAVVGQLEIDGAYTLTSAPPNSLALARPGEEHTAFTGRMLQLLREGDAQAGEFLSPRDIYRHLYSRLRAEGLPLPQQCGSGSADALGLVRNHRFYTMARRHVISALDDARQNARLFIDGYWRADFMAEMAEVVARVDRDRAVALFEEAAGIASDLFPLQSPTGALARVAARAATVDARLAERFFASAEKLSDELFSAPGGDLMPRPPRGVVYGLTTLVDKLAPIDPDRAERITERMIKKADEKASALIEIARAVADRRPDHAAQLCESAEQIATEITDQDARAGIIASLVGAVGNYDAAQATRLRKEAERLIAEITDPRAKAEILTELASAVARYDDAQAARLYQEADQVIAEITDHLYRLQASIKLAELLTDLDAAYAARIFDNAERIARGIESTGPNGLRMRILARALISVDLHRAERIVLDMEPDTYKVSALAKVARGLAREDPGRSVTLCEEGEEIAGCLPAWQGSDDALGEVAGALAWTDPGRAEYIAKTIPKSGYEARAKAMLEIAKAWLAKT